jgi:ACS family sodium-dependent inorganic phosphate cotransporter
MACGGVVDYLIRTGKVSRSVTRKTVTAIGALGPAIAFTALSFIRCNPTMAIFWICLAVMVNAAVLAGSNVNVLELSPNYAGTLRAILAIIANTNGFTAPAVIGYLTHGNVRS